MTVLSISRDDGSVAVEVSGPLDRELGEQLVEVTKAGLTVASDVVISLAAVKEFTPEGLAALVECAGLGAHVPFEHDRAWPGH